MVLESDSADQIGGAGGMGVRNSGFSEKVGLKGK